MPRSINVFPFHVFIFTSGCHWNSSNPVSSNFMQIPGPARRAKSKDLFELITVPGRCCLLIDRHEGFKLDRYRREIRLDPEAARDKSW